MKKNNSLKIIRILTILAFLAIMVIILFADARIMPKAIFALYGFHYGDKIGHFVLMGLFAFLVNLSLNMRMVFIFSRGFLLGSLIVAVLVTIEEYSQSFFPARTASLFDLAASYLGIFIIGRLSVWIPAKRIDSQILDFKFFPIIRSFNLTDESYERFVELFHSTNIFV